MTPRILPFAPRWSAAAALPPLISDSIAVILAMALFPARPASDVVIYITNMASATRTLSRREARPTTIVARRPPIYDAAAAKARPETTVVPAA